MNAQLRHRLRVRLQASRWLIRCLLTWLPIWTPMLACAQDNDEAALQAVHAEIVTLIGDAPCANVVHCRVLALGSRPCGGPDEFLAYSSITGNKELLDSKAFEYGFLQEEVRRKRKSTQGCEVLPTPRAVCVDRRCRLDMRVR
ncbi:MAG TPA: hypothetical protein VFA81_12285 [Burkholderiales bacterium]|nr:hypothetical protein [Burkholderiales bacterium]